MTLRRTSRPRAHVLAAAVWTSAVLPAVSARGQQPTVLECNEQATLRATPDFVPPVRGAVRYEWRDQNGRLLGAEEALTRGFPVGRFILRLVASAEEGRTAEARLSIEVRDTQAPVVRALVRSVETDTARVAGGFNVFEAAVFRATDVCDPNPILRAEPAGPYGAGNTPVRLSATDASGNSSAVAIEVFVAVPAPRRPVAPEVPPRAPARPEPPAPTTPEPTAPELPREQARPEPAVEPPALQPRPATDAVEPPGTRPLRWWVGAAGLLVAALFLIARIARRRPQPPGASLRARFSSDPGEHEIVLHDEGITRPRIEVTVRPRADRGEQHVDAGDSVLIQE